MPSLILFRGFFVCGVALLFGLLNTTPVAAQKLDDNGHINLVKLHLVRRKCELPKGDYLVLAGQPVGIVDLVVIYDLTQGKTTLVSGTHSRWKPVTADLSPEKIKQIRDILALDAVQKLPRDGDRIGLDGGAFVAFIKLGDRTQQLGHWEAHGPGIEPLVALYQAEQGAYDERMLTGNE